MNKIFVLAILFISNVSYCQDTQRFLYWGMRELTWEDFKGNPPQVRNGDVARIIPEVFYTYELKNDSLFFFVVCRMDKNKSWSVTNSEYDLAHEKGHFNISEIVARRLREYFSKASHLKYTPLDKINKEIDSIANSVYKIQDLYDEETFFGNDTLKQKKWNFEINKMMESLVFYTNRKGAFYYKTPAKKGK